MKETIVPRVLILLAEALYTPELQPHGSLKITGCMLLKPGQAA
jgi:hypothetical protein